MIYNPLPVPTDESFVTMCHRTGEHIFIFAGAEVPDGWPCDCGATRYRVSAAQGLAPSASEEPNEVSPEHSDPNGSEGDAQKQEP